MRKICALMLIAIGLGCVSVAPAQDAAKEKIVLPEGVIHVKVPPGDILVETIQGGRKPFLRVSAGKTVIETEALFLGDAAGATQIEALKKGLPWLPTGSGKELRIGSFVLEQGSEIKQKEFLTLDALKAGSLFVSSPSLTFRWGKESISKQ